jgi:hypothetical protein
MPVSVDFDQYQYYPSLRTRLAELRGYGMLPESDKRALLPTFVLGKYQQRSSSIGVAEVLAEKNFQSSVSA